MKKLFHYILFSIGMLCSVQGLLYAQESDSSNPAPIDYAEVESEKEYLIFDSITQHQKQTVSIKKLDTATVHQLRSDADFWYVNTVPPKTNLVPPRKTGSYDWLGNLVWVVVIGGFVAFLVWFILSANIQLFRKPLREKKHKGYEPRHSELEVSDLEEQIDAAINAGNYRFATRLLYLQILQLLSAKKLIRYQQQRTNAEYLSELFGSDYYPAFLRLTRHFEYSWYGLFDLPDTKFKQVHQDFLLLKNQIS